MRLDTEMLLISQEHVHSAKGCLSWVHHWAVCSPSQPTPDRHKPEVFKQPLLRAAIDTGSTDAPIPASHRWFKLPRPSHSLHLEPDQASLNSSPREKSFSAKVIYWYFEAVNKLRDKWVTDSWWCFASRARWGPQGGVKGRSTSESEEGGVLRTSHGGTWRPHLLTACVTGSLALHLQNYSRLCGSDSSVLKGTWGIRAAIQVKRITLWHSYIFVSPCSLLFIGWPRKEEWE